MNIDIELLRRDLIDYYGSATPMMPAAFGDVIDVDITIDRLLKGYASVRDLKELADRAGFDLEDYEIYTRGL